MEWTRVTDPNEATACFRHDFQEIVEPALSLASALGDELPKIVVGLGLTPLPDLTGIAAE